MNNNIYSWHAEVMVALERQELEREIASIRLLNDAGLSNPGLIERALIALGHKLVATGQRLSRQYTSPNQAYQTTSCRYAA
jgi:hypothetical protein